MSAASSCHSVPPGHAMAPRRLPWRNPETATPPLEIELVFSITDEAARRLLANPIERGPPIKMMAVYYDTPDLALRRAGYALRVRCEGGRWVQTLKSGSPGALVRGEFEFPLSKGRLDLSLFDAASLPRDLLPRLPELHPMFETHVRRRHKLIAFGDAEIEVALDEGELVAGARRMTLLEAELELKTGGRAALFSYARQLAAQGGLRLTLANKSDRGFALAAEALDGAVTYTPPLARMATIGEAIGALGGAALHQLGGNLDILQREPHRAALREAIAGAERLGTFLATFASVLGPGRRTIVAELDWLLGRLAAVRDLDRFIVDGFRPFAHWVDDRPAAALFGRALLRARRAACGEVQQAARSERVCALMLDVAELAGTAAVHADGASIARPISDFAIGILQRKDQELRAADGVLKTFDPAAHGELHVETKRTLYLLEAFEPVLPPRARSRAAWREALRKLELGLEDLREISVATSVAKHALDRLDTAEGDLAARAAFASGTIIIARFAKSNKTMRSAQRAFMALNAKPSPWASRGSGLA